MVGRAVFLATRPTPRTTAPESHVKFVLVVKPARKDISARIILQAPTLTPRALFRIRCPLFFHNCFYILKTIRYRKNYEKISPY